MEQDISFIGLGQMGFGMATNVRKKISKNATMFIHDVNSEACERFVKEAGEYGPIEIVNSAKEAATKSEILISIVPAAQHVRQVYLDKENGVMAAPKNDNRIILEQSTIDVDSTREVGKEVMDAGLGRYYDAPVSGGMRGAAAGTLAIMVGCPEDDKYAERVREIATTMGPPQKVFLCGQLGNGIIAKISNNYLSATFLLAHSEAMAMGIRGGVDPKVLANVVRNSSGNSWMFENMPPVPGINPNAPSSNDYKPGFTYELMLKDIGLGIDAAEKYGVVPTTAYNTRNEFKKASEDPRCKGKDFTSIYIQVTDGQIDGQ